MRESSSNRRKGRVIASKSSIGQLTSRDLSEAMPDAVVIVDKRGKIVRANEATEKLFGYSSDELLSLGIEELMPERYRKQHGKQRKSFLQNPRVRAMGGGRHLVAQTRDGQEVPVDIHLSWVEEGSERYAVAAIRDMTQHRRLEQRLADREERLQSLEALSADWYWEQDADLRFTFISGGDQDSYLNSTDKVLGNTRFELPYEWESPEALEKHKHVTAERKSFRDVLLRNPANDRYALVSGEPVFDEDGTFIGYRGISRDITAEKHAERALRESEGRFRALSDLSSDWYWRSDAQHRFTYMQGRDESAQLNKLENVVGKTRFELPYVWESPEVRAEHERVLAEHKPFRDLLLYNPDNDRFARTSGEPMFDDQGEFLGYQGVSRDVTVVKRAERALRKSETRFRALTALSYDWYWEQDADLRFTVMEGVSDKAYLTDESVEGKTRLELPYVWESPQAREAHERILAERKPFHDLLLHNPETDRYALISGEPMFDETGKFVGYQGVSRDVTGEKRAERALRESETRFRSLTALSADWYWEQDADLRFTFISGVNDATHLTTIEKVLGKTRTELPYDWESPEIRAEHERLLAERKPFRDLLLHNPENDRYALITGEPVFDDDGTFTGYQGVSRDVTSEKQSELAVRESEARFRALTAMSSDWYWEQDERFRFVYFSPTAGNNARLNIKSLVGRTRFELPLVWESEAAKQQHRETLEGCLPFRDLLLRTQSGDQYVLVSGEPTFGERGELTGYRGIAKDISAQKQAEAEAIRLAKYDPLTGLPNRNLLGDRIERAINRAYRNGARVAILFIDLDRFKTLNDSLGHGAGDDLLQQLSGRLSTILRASDTLCRFGGDEFVAVLEDTGDVGEIETIAHKVLEALSEPVEIQGAPYHAAASIGISLYPEDAKDAEALLRNADLAMYEAKANGGGHFRFFASEMNRRVAARAKLDRELRQAVTRQEFDVYLQPQYDTYSGKPVGAEALLRWYHPERGIVEPNEFIHAAEESGLIVPIGHLVFERTFKMMADWLKLGVVPPRIAINLSSRQLLDGEALLERIKLLLETTGVPPELIEFEITESLLIPNENNGTTKVLEAFGKMGIRLAIDDFGTGYSSLSYLKRLPVNAVKIDRSFVHDISSNDESTAIVRAVVGIARSMKLEVVTEGVESSAQLAVLRDFGCDTYQGFLGGDPMPRCKFEQTMLGISRRSDKQCHRMCGCTGDDFRQQAASKPIELQQRTGTGPVQQTQPGNAKGSRLH
jgi:diguanylate cyclase (GGDEF)-like protein/PAS domain S-box-containing protein